MVEQTSLELACPTDLSAYDLEDDSAICEEEPRAQNVNCGNYVFENSTGIHIGDRTYYTAPVTFVLPNGKGIKEVGEIPTIDGTLAVKSSTVLCEPKDTPPGKKFWELVSQWLKSPRNIGIAVCGTALVFAAVFIITFYSIRNKGDAEDDLPTNGSSRIRRRGEWLALPSKGTLEPLKVDPPHFVLVAHTAGSKCSTQPTCAAIVRNIQAGHVSLGWDDISYNFLVGGDGYAYEGRGWGKKGAHTIPFNAYSIAISFIGNFMIDLPPRRQIEAAFIVMEEGVRLGKLPKNYKIIFHKQVLATESPGAALIEEIKKWPHWSICDDECEEISRNYTNTVKKG